MNLEDLLLTRRAMVAGSLFFADWLRAGQNHQHEPESQLLKNYQPKFFSPEDFEALQSFTEILIPSDETPGAREARCATYIDFLLQSSDDAPQVQKSWRNAMESLRTAGFHKAAPPRRLEMISEMAQHELKPPADTPAPPTYFAYRLIKQQNTFAFYTSREGIILTLDYKGNSYNPTFPPCTHPEHQVI